MSSRHTSHRALRLLLAGAAAATLCFSGATSASAEIAPTGTISGSVTATTGGEAAPGFVSASDADGLAVQSAIDPDGHYELAVEPGAYVVKFTSTDPRLLSEYWEDARAEQDAIPVVVEEGQVLVLDASLESAAAIRGTVRAEGVPLPDAILEAWADGELAGMAYANSVGVYELVLPAGTYTLRARGETYDPIYATQYFSSAKTASAATPLILGSHADLTGIDFDLARGGDIRGRITGADAALPQGGAVVTAYLWHDGWQPVASVTTAGDYGFGYIEPPFSTDGGPLPEGTYVIGVEADGFCPQFFGEASEFEEAETIALAPRDVISGIDVALSTECPEPQPEPTIALSATAVRAGDTLTVSGDGFAPGQEVVFELHSDLVRIGTLSADADGRVSGALRIPVTTVPGAHTIAALTSGRVRASIAVDVAAAVDPGQGGAGGTSGAGDGGTGGASSPQDRGSVGTLATTGAEVPVALLLAGVGLAAFGATLLRRRTPAR